MAAVYCHGLPGSQAELEALAPAARHRGIAVLNRLATRRGAYRENVLSAFDALRVETPTEVVGFSLGAMAALHIAAHRPTAVRKLILVSPAAPLELGDFLPAMAGRAVFRAALSPPSLYLLSALQLASFSLAPELALKSMFASSGTAERQLLLEPAFRAMVLDGLKTCLGAQQASYRCELAAYVRPWEDILSQVSCAVDLRHGEEDAWAPAAMSHALQERLGASANLRTYPGLGHYGTLQAVLPELL